MNETKTVCIEGRIAKAYLNGRIILDPYKRGMHTVGVIGGEGTYEVAYVGSKREAERRIRECISDMKAITVCSVEAWSSLAYSHIVENRRN